MYIEKYSFWICKLIFNASHAYLLLPHILEGHCPLDMVQSLLFQFLGSICLYETDIFGTNMF